MSLILTGVNTIVVHYIFNVFFFLFFTTILRHLAIDLALVVQKLSSWSLEIMKGRVGQFGMTMVLSSLCHCCA